jgi:predicted O-methyltransferase YrrM
MDRLNQLLKKCQDDNVPIVRDKTLSLMKNIIVSKRYTSILEIGAAYGYSAYCLSQNSNITKLVTIEKNIESYNIANAFLHEIKKIELINANAFDIQLDSKFDFIFLDGPKSHQEKLVVKFLNNLNPGGTMFIDNIFLKKFENIESLTKNQISLIKKVNQFKE